MGLPHVLKTKGAFLSTLQDRSPEPVKATGWAGHRSPEAMKQPPMKESELVHFHLTFKFQYIYIFRSKKKHLSRKHLTSSGGREGATLQASATAWGCQKKSFHCPLKGAL